MTPEPVVPELSALELSALELSALELSALELSALELEHPRKAAPAGTDRDGERSPHVPRPDRRRAPLRSRYGHRERLSSVW
ncbi:hypothetical protein Misp02_20390 [Microtetraspora sp. NBRC 16547]|nr:hypothetical protein Misp02_20390 [Microtetraspora sp. NBRC 16547]